MTITIDLKQNDNQLSVSINYENLPPIFNSKQDYIFNTVKFDNNGSSKKLEYNMTYAEWFDEKTLWFKSRNNTFHSISNDDSYSTIEETTSDYAMNLNGNVLTLFNPFEKDPYTCEFNKEG